MDLPKIPRLSLLIVKKNNLRLAIVQVLTCVRVKPGLNHRLVVATEGGDHFSMQNNPDGTVSLEYDGQSQFTMTAVTGGVTLEDFRHLPSQRIRLEPVGRGE